MDAVKVRWFWFTGFLGIFAGVLFNNSGAKTEANAIIVCSVVILLLSAVLTVAKAVSTLITRTGTGRLRAEMRGNGTRQWRVSQSIHR
ncbi:MAG: hypothetical protein IJ449_11630 [Clostridia bacterium]|nr:hypothetical protein [Clostridia bacterium]